MINLPILFVMTPVGGCFCAFFVKSSQNLNYLNVIQIFTFFVSSKALKRLTTIFLTCLILGSSTGTTVAFHYCGKSLQDVAIFSKPKQCCGGMEMPVGCCHDEKVQVKSDDFKVAQLVSTLGFVPVFIQELPFPILDFTLQFEKVQTSHLLFQLKSHPPSRPDVVIVTQSFLI